MRLIGRRSGAALHFGKDSPLSAPAFTVVAPVSPLALVALHPFHFLSFREDSETKRTG